MRSCCGVLMVTRTSNQQNEQRSCRVTSQLTVVLFPFSIMTRSPIIFVYSSYQIPNHTADGARQGCIVRSLPRKSSGASIYSCVWPSSGSMDEATRTISHDRYNCTTAACNYSPSRRPSSYLFVSHASDNSPFMPFYTQYTKLFFQKCVDTSERS